MSGEGSIGQMVCYVGWSGANYFRDVHYGAVWRMEEWEDLKSGVLESPPSVSACTFNEAICKSLKVPTLLLALPSMSF